jgi:hypothetical protein
MAHLPQAELVRRLDEARQQVQIGGRYRHYSDDKLEYVVVDVALIEGDDTAGVVYRTVYGQPVTWVRPLASWLETVEVAGRQVPRFTKVTD